jgi:hypothetical protein
MARFLKNYLDNLPVFRGGGNVAPEAKLSFLGGV